jgi:sulfhydrogenase subunit alpha
MKEIRIPALARIEGHGNITVQIAKNKVQKVLLNIPEGPRLFETLVVGKTPSEVVNIVPRICAICSVSHRYAAIRALERALDIKETKATSALRTLMHYGEMIESNSLHAYLLALPDFLGYPNAIAMVDKYAPAVLRALRLKKFGNYIMEITTARWTHGENAAVGGFGATPSREQLLDIKNQALALLPDAQETVELFRNLHYPTSMEEGMTFMCLKPPTEKYGFVGNSVLISTGQESPIEDYLKLTNERVVDHSNAKRCSYNDKPFVVGALARMNLLGERLHGKAAEAFKRCYSLSWIRNPLYTNLAQVIEILFCVEQTPLLVDQILKNYDKIVTDSKIQKPTGGTGKNVGAVEAPRGTLYHYYEVSRGLISGANMIIPTTQNLDAMETHIRVAAENLLKSAIDSAQGKKDMDLILEMVVRAYDPCISCSVHVIHLDK